MQYMMFPRPPMEQGNLTGLIAVGWDRNPIMVGTLTGNVEVMFTSDPPYACPLWWVVTQDAGGGNTIDWSSVANLSGAEPVVSTDPNTTTVIPLFWDGTNYNV